MTDIEDNEDGNQDAARRKGKSGSGTVGGGIRLPASKIAEVAANFKYLDAKEALAALAEFFSELPARASAHLQVSWANLANQGFAIVTDLVKLGQRIYEYRLNPTRENRERLRLDFNILVAG
ncbi:MAG TPA: hypothetical protein VMV79_03070 [Alphaproteobacteria bacterium]|nr:hypothetical protein [Alphaproteobacteria bacterium]